MEDVKDFEKIVKEYIDAGLSILPADRDKKIPIRSVGKWREYIDRQPTDYEIKVWMSNGCDALSIVCGKISGNLEVLDFDQQGKAFDKWESLVRKQEPELFDSLLVETTQSGGYHVAYRCEEEVCGSRKLAHCVDSDTGQIQTLIETRGQGGLIICSPTDGYEVLQGSWQKLPAITAEQRRVLLLAAWELDECKTEATFHDPCVFADTEDYLQVNRVYDQGNFLRPGDDYNNRGNIRELLASHGWQFLYNRGDNDYWRRPGKDKGGCSATYSISKKVFYVFSSNAAPFEPLKGYSPFGVYTLLEHEGDFADASIMLRYAGYGESAVDKLYPEVDLSKLLSKCKNSDNLNEDCVDESCLELEDPGNIPEELFEVPGLVRRVMDFTLQNAPYPNVGLAFCGAMALQSFLCGRKIRTQDDLRPNLYLLALASSGTGKDFPRKVNSNILFKSGLIDALGDKFASGEGIQDALYRNNSMLFQNDEMDGVLRQINNDKDCMRESIPMTLLMLYTSANDFFPLRVKANQQESLHINQPHMTLFGTATPQFFYESLSQRMLTNGLFARMMIIDIGTRGEGQTPGSASDVPQNILDIVKHWAEFKPPQSISNFANVNPIPQIVPYHGDAKEAIEAFQREADAHWREADERNDEVARTAWSRCCENAKKLVLIYACSENHTAPSISVTAVDWACRFALHQIKRQLYLAGTYVAENSFHGECLKVIRSLQKAPFQTMKRQNVLRMMKCKAVELDQIMDTLLQRGDVERVAIKSKTKAAVGYRLIG